MNNKSLKLKATERKSTLVNKCFQLLSSRTKQGLKQKQNPASAKMKYWKTEKALSNFIFLYLLLQKFYLLI